MKERLIETRLIFIGGDQDAVFQLPEFFGELLFADLPTVHLDFSQFFFGWIVGIDDGSGKSDKGAEISVMLELNVLVGGLLVTYGFQAGTGDHHRFGAPADAVADVLSEVLNNDLCLLSDVVGVQAHEAGESLGGLLLFDLGIALRGFEEPIVGAVEGVILQYIKDETLLDGLAHAVFVERLGLAVGVRLTENLNRLVFRGGGKGEETEVWLLFPAFDNSNDFLLVVGELLLLCAFMGYVADTFATENGFHLGGAIP